jgi:hypothetical protein
MLIPKLMSSDNEVKSQETGMENNVHEISGLAIPD